MSLCRWLSDRRRGCGGGEGSPRKTHALLCEVSVDCNLEPNCRVQKEEKKRWQGKLREPREPDTLLHSKHPVGIPPMTHSPRSSQDLCPKLNRGLCFLFFLPRNSSPEQAKVPSTCRWQTGGKKREREREVEAAIDLHALHGPFSGCIRPRIPH